MPPQQPPRQPIQTVVGNLRSIRHEALGEGRPDEVLAEIECPDCGAIVRWSNRTDYPDGGIVCNCPDKVWSMQAVTNVPRQPGPQGKGV